MLLVEKKKLSVSLFIYWHHVVQYDALVIPLREAPIIYSFNAPYLVNVIKKIDEGGGKKTIK